MNVPVTYVPDKFPRQAAPPVSEPGVVYVPDPAKADGRLGRRTSDLPIPSPGLVVTYVPDADLADGQGIGSGGEGGEGGGGGPGPILPVTAFDNFDAYSDGALLASQSGWASVAGDFSVTGGKIRSITFSIRTGVRRTTPIFGSDQRSWVTLSGIGTSIGTFGPAVRMQPDAISWYGLYWDHGSSVLYLFEEINGGNYTGINSISGKLYVNGNKLRITATGLGSAIRLSVDEDIGAGWSSLLANQIPISKLNSGQPGVVGYDDKGPNSLSGTDWSGEEIL